LTLKYQRIRVFQFVSHDLKLPVYTTEYLLTPKIDQTDWNNMTYKHVYILRRQYTTCIWI